MRSFTFSRTALIAALLIANLGGAGTAFADAVQMPDAQRQVQPQQSNPSPFPPGFDPDDGIHG